MSRRLSLVAALLLLALVPSCQKSGKGKVDKNGAGDKDLPPSKGPGARAGTDGGAAPPKRRPVEQVEPPMDVKAPPADAVKTASGIAYKFLTTSETGDHPGKNDTVTVNYTGWRTSGETYFSTKTRGKPQPMPLANTAVGWTEALQLMKVGDRAIFWIPPALAFKGKPKEAETLVFDVELVSIDPAPPIPADVAAPPKDATKTKSGLAYKILTKGTGKEKPSSWDSALINYTAWDASGRMFDSTAARKRPRPALVFKEAPGLAEALQTMVVGEHKRVWIPETLTKKGPNVPTGTLVYDIELTEIKKNPEPPPVPKDVAAPPADALKSEKGVFYKVLKAGTGTEHPKPTDTVVIDYTGWNTAGNMIDSSTTRGQSARFPLNGVMAGWTDGVGLMVVGETVRLWIPEELAYKGSPGRPQGMLVFDITLKEIVAGKPGGASPHGGMPGMSPHGGMPGGAEADPHAIGE